MTALREDRQVLVRRAAERLIRNGSGPVRMTEFLKMAGAGKNHVNVKAFLVEIGLYDKVIAKPSDYLLSMPEGQTKQRRAKRVRES